MERISARFEGRVQGVGFRATTRSIASRAGITGWVRNEPDGSVQLEAQGSDVRGFLASLRAQMGKFIVRDSVSMVSPVSGEIAFEIRR